ncbi:hypothetical protein TrLO_g5395 [Triparma laevis f. longispina]|uniref:Gamma-interferon-inducible lysosomal thiol reductase n=1 Tax=Triparma laevis f. longispina TaxID=1714387 RepID=A0A9W7CDT7_9STRA|nr:hypothetical protein TrLO_g5395 [Triparma laevis f. longispina]
MTMLSNTIAAAMLSTANSVSVSVHVFAESQCPACIDYTVNQLAPLLAALPTAVNLSAYPYGNANSTLLDDGTYEFQCQHGTNECTANMWEACAIEHYPEQSTWFPFYECIEGSDISQNRDGEFETQLVEDCAEKTGLDFYLLTSCAGSNPVFGSPEDGNLTMQSIAIATEKSGHTFCPWVVIDGVPLTEEQIDNNDDLTQLVCQALLAKTSPDDTLPPICLN